MRILLTGHKGYIGAVAGPLLRSAGYEVVGLDTDLFAGCDFGKPALEIPEVRKDIRNLTKVDLEGFDAVVHLAALSNDPLSNLDPGLTYDINHKASVRLAELAKQAGGGRALQPDLYEKCHCLRRVSASPAGSGVERLCGIGAYHGPYSYQE